MNKAIITKEPILKIGVVTLNNYLYNKEAAEKICDLINSNLTFGQIDNPEGMDYHTMDLQKASHQLYNAVLEGDTIYCDVEILESDKGRFLKENIKNYVFRPRLLGTTEDKVVTVEKLLAVDAILKKNDTFLKSIELSKLNEFMHECALKGVVLPNNPFMTVLVDYSDQQIPKEYRGNKLIEYSVECYGVKQTVYITKITKTL